MMSPLPGVLKRLFAGDVQDTATVAYEEARHLFAVQAMSSLKRGKQRREDGHMTPL